MRNTIDITNQIFGRLTAIKFAEVRKGNQYWLFKCSCGNRTVVQKQSVKRGNTTSCGCYQREATKERFTTHGMKKTKFYHVWRDIQTRCYNPNYPRFKNYGGRGIKCEWRKFKEFRDDMLESYNAHIKELGEKQTTIDRIDNNSDYCKENCRWTTRKIQQRNRRNNHLITYKGKTKCLAEWSEDLGIPYQSLYQRLGRAKWSVVRAFNT